MAEEEKMTRRRDSRTIMMTLSPRLVIIGIVDDDVGWYEERYDR